MKKFSSVIYNTFIKSNKNFFPSSSSLIGNFSRFYSSKKCCSNSNSKNSNSDSLNYNESIYCDCTCECDRCLCGPPKVEIGKPAPKFTKKTLENGQFVDMSLSDFEGSWVCLFFYPLDFTFVCPTEIIAFSDRSKEFEELDCKVIGVSVDSHFSHYAWTQSPRNEGGIGEIEIPLVSDLTKSMARDYGVLNDAGLAFRGLFLIDPNQNVRQIIINDTTIGRDVDETLRLLEALQYFENFGELCPIGWKRGDDTITPNLNDFKDYFEKHE